MFVEIRADAANGTGVSLYRLGLEPFEFQVFKMGLIVLLEMGFFPSRAESGWSANILYQTGTDLSQHLWSEQQYRT